MMEDQTGDTEILYPPFEEILELNTILENAVSKIEKVDEYELIAEIRSFFWNILWFSYPEQSYQYLMKMKKSKQDFSHQISTCINQIRSTVEYDFYSIEFPYEQDTLLGIIQQITHQEVREKIENLIQRYMSFDIFHFKYQANKFKSFSNRLLNDMNRMLANDKFISSIKLDTTNKYSYYISIIDNYHHLSTGDTSERSLWLLNYFKTQAATNGYDDIIYGIDLIIDMLDIDMEPEIKEIELKNLHLQDSDTIASVERAYDTLVKYTHQRLEEEYLDSISEQANSELHKLEDNALNEAAEQQSADDVYDPDLEELGWYDEDEDFDPYSVESMWDDDYDPNEPE